jgi:hypothetical protein
MPLMRLKMSCRPVLENSSLPISLAFAAIRQRQFTRMCKSGDAGLDTSCISPCSKLIRLAVHPIGSRLDLGCALCVAQSLSGDGNS